METGFLAIVMTIMAVFAIGFMFGMVTTLFVGQYQRVPREPVEVPVKRHIAKPEKINKE